MNELEKGLHWVYWIDAGVSRFGLAQVAGRAPCLRVFVLHELEKIVEESYEYKPFLLRVEMIMDFERVDIGWIAAPDRIKRMFNQPIRATKDGAETDSEH